jgi:hypothetical protein
MVWYRKMRVVWCGVVQFGVNWKSVWCHVFCAFLGSGDHCRVERSSTDQHGVVWGGVGILGESVLSTGGVFKPVLVCANFQVVLWCLLPGCFVVFTSGLPT